MGLLNCCCDINFLSWDVATNLRTSSDLLTCLRVSIVANLFYYVIRDNISVNTILTLCGQSLKLRRTKSSSSFSPYLWQNSQSAPETLSLPLLSAHSLPYLHRRTGSWAIRQHLNVSLGRVLTSLSIYRELSSQRSGRFQWSSRSWIPCYSCRLIRSESLRRVASSPVGYEKWLRARICHRPVRHVPIERVLWSQGRHSPECRIWRRGIPWDQRWWPTQNQQ